MTPLLALTLIAALTPATHPATIDHVPSTPTTEAAMAQGQNQGNSISFPTGPPPTRHGPPTTRARIGMDASNPTLPTRHGYPSPNNRNQLTNSRPTTFTDTRTTR